MASNSEHDPRLYMTWMHATPLDRMAHDRELPAGRHDIPMEYDVGLPLVRVRVWRDPWFLLGLPTVVCAREGYGTAVYTLRSAMGDLDEILCTPRS